MFEFRFVKGAIRRSAVKRRRAEGRIASQRRRGHIGRKNKTQTTAFMFVLETAGGAYQCESMSEEGVSEADMSSVRACSPRKMHRKKGGVGERHIRRRCVEGPYRQKVRRCRRGRVEGGLSEEVVSEEWAHPRARLRISAVRPPVGQRHKASRSQVG